MAATRKGKKLDIERNNVTILAHKKLCKIFNYENKKYNKNNFYKTRYYNITSTLN